jgi:hypothetical protein
MQNENAMLIFHARADADADADADDKMKRYKAGST